MQVDEDAGRNVFCSENHGFLVESWLTSSEKQCFEGVQFDVLAGSLDGSSVGASQHRCHDQFGPFVVREQSQRY